MSGWGNLNDDETYKIIGAAMKVHRYFGPGFLEAVYGDALEVELQNDGIPYEREKEIRILYQGIELGHKFSADFLCYDSIIVELKAVDQIIGKHKSQILHYLKATGFRRGLLINFGENSLVTERFVL